MTDLWQRVCLGKRRKRKPFNRLGFMKELGLEPPPRPWGVGLICKTCKRRPCEVIWKFPNNGCAAKVDALKWLKKESCFKSSRACKSSKGFCRLLSLFPGIPQKSSKPYLSPQSPLSTAGFAWTHTIACQGQYMIWGLSYQYTFPRSNRIKTSSFLAEESLI